MRTIRGALVCAIAIGALQLLTSFWWWVLVVPFAYGAAGGTRSGWDGFRSGALGGGGLWFLAGLWQATTSGRLVAERVAVMLQVGSPWVVLAATALLAMIVGGLAGGTGHLFREALRGHVPSGGQRGAALPAD